jgi:serine/threonine protein kinase
MPPDPLPSGPLGALLILQFCAQGELLGMLKKAAAEGEPIALLDKMQMAREVAQGMVHLSKEHFIHRDLACRNVLYSEGMCKIADFGLSRGSRVGEAITPDEWTHENADRADRGETHEDYYKSRRLPGAMDGTRGNGDASVHPSIGCVELWDRGD